MSNVTWVPDASIESLLERSSKDTKWSSVNSSSAGHRTVKVLPTGTADIQLYSLATPNGNKVGILLEELGIDYDAHVINISDGSQFGSGFCELNPNSKIPAAVDYNGPNGRKVELFESGSIVLYLAEKHNKFIPSDTKLRAEVMSWMFWQVSGQGPATGSFGHFYNYAPPDKIETRDYGVARYGMEVMRLSDVLNNHLATRTYLVGEEYSIADIMCFPWYYCLKIFAPPNGVKIFDYLGMDRYIHVNAWIDRIAARPAVQRGLNVCQLSKGPKPWEAKVEVEVEVEVDIDGTGENKDI